MRRQSGCLALGITLSKNMSCCGKGCLKETGYYQKKISMESAAFHYAGDHSDLRNCQYKQKCSGRKEYDRRFQSLYGFDSAADGNAPWSGSAVMNVYENNHESRILHEL